MRRTLTLGLSAALIGLLASVSPAAPPNAIEATVRPYSATVADRSYPVRDASGASLAAASWRVVAGTGNCCENYIASTETGRILDFGGGSLRYSDDAGQSWHAVSSIATLGAEGAVVDAPGGDIVGVTWDPYSGDRLEAFKFEAASGKWYYAPNTLHQPFFDRPYITVVPGPFQVGGTTVPYITYMLGGWPQKTTYMSTDGLNYVPATSPSQPLGTSRSEYLPVKSDANADSLQPLTVPAIAPLAGGGAIAWRPGSDESLSLSILQPPSTTWSPFTFPGGTVLEGRLLADSAGALHNVSINTGSVIYKMSSDGGRTWSTTTADLPAGYRAIAPTFDRFWDFKANATLGMGVVSLYARNTATEKDQNLVLVFSTREGQPRLNRTLFAGKGDKAYGSALGASDRLDFITVAILPGGQVATSFMDTESSAPVVGITSSSQAPSTTGQPKPSSSASPTLVPTTDPSASPAGPPDDGSADVTDPRITTVSDRPDPITPNGDGRRDRATIRFTISETAEVTVSILTKRGRLVRILRDASQLRAGTHKATWNGRDSSGRRVRAGLYFYEIIAIDAAGNRSQNSEGTITVRR